jgi:hypothetical protein
MPKLLKPSQALLRVKSMLPTEFTYESENSPYICDNIAELARQGKITDETKDMLRGHINTLLDNRYSLSGWLTDNGHITREQMLDDLNNHNGTMLQYTRQNWLNDMHFYFKSKGM